MSYVELCKGFVQSARPEVAVWKALTAYKPRQLIDRRHTVLRCKKAHVVVPIQTQVGVSSLPVTAA